MFCPKCGQQNPETGKFCRSCGTDLGNVSDALMGKSPRDMRIVDKKGKPVSFEGAITKIFSGLAFVIVACILGYTGMAGGRGWWFWMLIPGIWFAWFWCSTISGASATGKKSTGLFTNDLAVGVESGVKCFATVAANSIRVTGVFI